MPSLPASTLTKSFLPVFLFFVFCCVMTDQAVAKERPILMQLPAETLLPILQRTLPWDIPVHGRQVQGEIRVESLQQLSVRDNVISVQGVLSGKDTAVNTQIAGQEVHFKIGHVSMSLHCDLHLRFEAKKQTLFVKPRFKSLSGNGQDAMLKPLLLGLDNKEITVDCKKILRKLRVPVDGRLAPLPLEVLGIEGTNNALILRLQEEKAQRK